MVLTHFHRSTEKPLPVPPGEEATLPKSPTATSDIASETNAGKTSSTPTLPRAPTKRLPREEIVNEVLDLTDQVASTTLFRPDQDLVDSIDDVCHSPFHHLCPGLT